jgi:hypothetical protein
MYDRIPSLTLDATIRLYVLADRFDSYTLRTSIITSLITYSDSRSVTTDQR